MFLPALCGMKILYITFKSGMSMCHIAIIVNNYYVSTRLIHVK